MNVQNLKSYIYENNLINDILLNIGCHNIKPGNEYYTCSNKNGDRKNAITVYNNENLTCVNYTRNMVKGKINTDLIDLVTYTLDTTFTDALNEIASMCGISYYHDFDEEVPESLLLTKFIKEMSNHDNDLEDEMVKLEPISRNILNYYKPYVNDLFMNDNIGYETQVEFGIGYDEETNRITIPIFSEIGDLVGVKGRIFDNSSDIKYLYLEPTKRSSLLYGLNKTKEYIKDSGVVFVLESEKGVMQLWEYGFRNSVATCGKKVSKHQITMLSRMRVKLIFCFDKDVGLDELKELKEQFINEVEIYAILDNDNVLSDKESPSDDYEKWNYLVNNHVYNLREVV